MPKAETPKPQSRIFDIHFEDYIRVGPIQFIHVANDNRPYSVEIDRELREVVITWSDRGVAKNVHVPLERVHAYRLTDASNG